jgi:1,4-dihydroxy-2-naphthoate octaprenyltransferase
MTTLHSQVSPSPIRVWGAALRPKTLPAAVVPVLVGVACAHRLGWVSWHVTLTCLTVSLCLQVASNFANDVFDFEKGADTPDRVGPARAVAQGWIAPSAMKAAVAVALAGAALAGSYLVWIGGWPMLALGALALICAVAYTAGPFPLGYNGLGDICVFFFFGPVAVCGTTFLNTRAVSPVAWMASAAIGALTTAVLVVNNVRDEATGGILEYAALLGLAYLTPLLLLTVASLGPWVFLPWLSLPLALRLVSELGTLQGPALNRTLARTAQLLVWFGLLLGVGIVLG